MAKKRRAVAAATDGSKPRGRKVKKLSEKVARALEAVAAADKAGSAGSGSARPAASSASAAAGDAGADPGRRLYAAGDMILLVGEGDFGFARALLERLKDSAHIVATTLDTAKLSRRKYPTSSENARRLLAAGMQVMYGIDAQELHRRPEFRHAFTKIVFNFPHLGSDDAGIEEHQALLRGFLASAARCLEPLPDAEVHITLKSGEPYASWRVQQLAKPAAPAGSESVGSRKARGGAASTAETAPLLRCDRVVPFEAKRYPGYVHRRTKGDAYAEARGLDDENVVAGARTTIFRLRKEVLPQLSAAAAGSESG